MFWGVDCLYYRTTIAYPVILFLDCMLVAVMTGYFAILWYTEVKNICGKHEKIQVHLHQTIQKHKKKYAP